MTGADLAAFAAAYGLGTIPFAWLLVRLRSRKHLEAAGSGNVGALNAMRVTRSRWVGAIVLALDGLKGAAAVWLAHRIGGDPGLGLVGTVAGHNYNLWLSLAARRPVGGKGFAAAAGGMLSVWPGLVPLWLGVVLVTWTGLWLWRGITDEAPATATATVVLVPAAGWLYGLRGLLAVGALASLILPKHVREVRSLLFARESVPPAS